MINITIGKKGIQDQYARAYCFIVSEDDVAACVQNVTTWYPSVSELMKARDFTGKKGQIFSVPFFKDDTACDMIFVGIGKAHKAKHISLEDYRRAIGSGIRHAIALRVTSLAIIPPHASLFGSTSDIVAEQTIIATLMASYHFDEFITDKSRKETHLVDVFICGDAVTDLKETTLERALTIGHAVNKARHWVDCPPTSLTPPVLAQAAVDMAKERDLKATLFDEQDIIKMGMGGLAGVSRGSEVDCCLLILEYKSSVKDAPTVAFVGKGITFDSGGLSLKPARHMETMKEDMSGAAAVIAAMEAIALLKPAINVIGIAPMSENLPSGKATKPGDIVTFYNGKTAEIKNTDAEGRLILADALSYAVKHYKLDAIMDLATLTGACAYALGPYYSGMMSEHEDFVRRVQESAQRSGDHVWRLPFGDDYKQAIKSSVADICNIGNEKIMAGATTAAHFLQNFVDEVPWVHLDIAGTAFDVPNISYYRSGGTGVGVRLIIDLVTHWS